MGLTEAEINDPMWSDMPQSLPDDSIILTREIRKAFDGEDFKYIPAGENRQKDLIGFDQDEYIYYLNVHLYSDKFGLPNGKGWVHELPWVPSFLLYMSEIREVTKAWITAKNSKSDSGSASPSDFMSGG